MTRSVVTVIEVSLTPLLSHSAVFSEVDLVLHPTVHGNPRRSMFLQPFPNRKKSIFQNQMHKNEPSSSITKLEKKKTHMENVPNLKIPHETSFNANDAKLNSNFTHAYK